MQLHVEFMNAPRGSMARAANAVKQADGGMFWWTISIIVLMAMAAVSWIGSIYIFTHPEKPFNYRLLSRIHRLEEIKQFNEKDMPKGKNLMPPDLFQRFFPFTQENLVNHNEHLRRSYLTNYRSRDEKPYFVRGRFRVIHARPLTKDDVFPCGMVVRAVAVNDDGKEYRNVIVEYVLPTAKPPVGMELAAGDMLDIDSRKSKKRLHAVAVNVHRLNEDVLVFTVVPLMYGEHLLDSAKHLVLTAEPPGVLNMSGRFPITDGTLGTVEAPPRVAAAGN
jgi:hypothetical protein